MASVVASLPLYHVGDASISLQFVEELFQHLTSHFSQLVTIEDFMHWFNESSPMEVCCAVLVFITFSCWFVALVTQNHSQVDRIWSIIPWVYVWQFQQRNTRDVRLLLMALLTTTWGLRLTFNFARKGGYSLSEEDYRWPVLRKKIGSKVLFELFNFSFIAIFQNVLLWLISVPATFLAWKASCTPAASLTVLDVVAAALFVVFLAFEALADQQQWTFQNRKHEMIRDGQRRMGDYAVGFLRHGLFKYSRHPNFFCEICIWWVFYLFSVSVTGAWLNWCILGPVLLTLLFQGSTSFTESITISKYPAYKKYQQTTSRLIPWFPAPLSSKKKK